MSGEEIQKIQDAIELLFGSCGVFDGVAQPVTGWSADTDYATLEKDEIYEEIEKVCGKIMRFNLDITENEKHKDKAKLNNWNNSAKVA
jgi:hypothetical protein